MWAQPAKDHTDIAQWHFNILGVEVSVDDATINTAYRAQIFQAHPDRKNAKKNALRKSQMLNEAKSVLMDEAKRRKFERGWDSLVCEQNFERDDIVMLQSLSNERYKYKYARVVSDNLGCSFEKKFTVKTQHACAQYHTAYASDSSIVNVTSSILQRRLMRVYGDPERRVASRQWSNYYKKGDVVLVQDVEEAPWYNDMEAIIVGYNEDLMRFDVELDGERLSFLPHNISTSRKVSDAPSEQSEKEMLDNLVRECKEAAERWADYYAIGDWVTICHDKETPEFNGRLARVLFYEHETMYYHVMLDEDELEFMPHNLSPAPAPAAAPAAAPAPAQAPAAAPAAAPAPARAPAPAAPPAATEFGVGQSVEVRWRNDTGDAQGGSARRTTWHVGVVEAVVREGGVVVSYDVRMPGTFAKEPGSLIRAAIRDIQPKRKRGKRAAPGSP